MTEAARRAFIVSGLRSKSRRWHPVYDTLNAAKVGRMTNESTGRMAMHYRCAQCGGNFPQKQVAVDHIEPVVDVEQGFVDWNTFIDRLFGEQDGLQVLCKTCHDSKTRHERDARKKKR